jgi:methionyl-tRNA formyltransferase
VPTLDALLKSSIAVEAVVTNPDRPAGRGMSPAASPVKARAQEAGIEVLQPRGGRDPALAERLRAQPPEVATVVAYGHILPGHLLEIPPLGFVNLHFSMLPRYRGAAPVQRAIMEGATSTGVSIILLTPGMDEGPVLASRSEEIRPRDTAGSLGERLALAGADLVPPTIMGYASGAIQPSAQEEAEATYAPKIRPEEARLDWTHPAPHLYDVVRGLNPEPMAWTTFRGNRLRVLEVGVLSEEEALPPGALSESGGDAVVGTGEAAVSLVAVQPAGKRVMSGSEWLRGLRLRPGERLE